MKKCTRVIFVLCAHCRRYDILINRCIKIWNNSPLENSQPSHVLRWGKMRMDRRKKKGQKNPFILYYTFPTTLSVVLLCSKNILRCHCIILLNCLVCDSACNIVHSRYFIVTAKGRRNFGNFSRFEVDNLKFELMISMFLYYTVNFPSVTRR